ncbi:hypothetical protein C8R43DRAFT_1003345 [Mycena crocata]|nr:hypothetical protein C8R43DRAFT_1003345 [Mycena crocata]
MTEYTSPVHTVPHFPEDLTIPQFLFDYQHPIRLHRESGIPWLVDAVTGKAVLQDEVGAADVLFGTALNSTISE